MSQTFLFPIYRPLTVLKNVKAIKLQFILTVKHIIYSKFFCESRIYTTNPPPPSHTPHPLPSSSCLSAFYSLQYEQYTLFSSGQTNSLLISHLFTQSVITIFYHFNTEANAVKNTANLGELELLEASICDKLSKARENKWEFYSGGVENELAELSMIQLRAFVKTG